MTQPEETRHEPPRGARAVNVASGAGFTLAMGGDVRLMGWSLIESTGAAPALVDLVDGDPVSGNRLAVIALTANQSETTWLAGHGVQVVTQLGLSVTAGAVRGVLYVIDN